MLLPHHPTSIPQIRSAFNLWAAMLPSFSEPSINKLRFSSLRKVIAYRPYSWFTFFFRLNTLYQHSEINALRPSRLNMKHILNVFLTFYLINSVKASEGNSFAEWMEERDILLLSFCWWCHPFFHFSTESQTSRTSWTRKCACNSRLNQAKL